MEDSTISKQRLGREGLGAGLGTADVQRADSALVVGGHRHGLEDAGDLSVVEAGVAEALLRALGDHLLRARTGGHALGLHSHKPARSARRGHGRSEQRVDLLGERAGDRGRLVLGVARRDRDLGATAVLAVAYTLGDMGGERLGLEGLAQDHVVDRLVHHLLEAGHVRALLLGPEVDEALKLGIEELLDPVRADADDLLHAGHADARQAHLGRGRTGLDVAPEERNDSVMAATHCNDVAQNGAKRTNPCTLAAGFDATDS